MVGQLQMTKDMMKEGFAKGKTLTQEEWAHPDEIKWVDDFIAEGLAYESAKWEYLDNFQCSRRKVTGVIK